MPAESSLPLILLARHPNGDLEDEYDSRPAPERTGPTGGSPCAHPIATLGRDDAAVLIYGVVPAELTAPMLCVRASGEPEPSCTSWVARQYTEDGPRYLTWPEPEHAGLAEEDRNKAPRATRSITAGTLYEAWIVAGGVDGVAVEQPVRVYYGSATQFQQLVVDRARFMTTFCAADSTRIDGVCTCGTCR